MTLRSGAGLARRTARGWSGIVAFVLCVAAGISPPFPAHASVQLQSFGVTPSGGITPKTSAAPQSVAPIVTATPARDSVSDAVGATLATFRVDEAANATYSIPIQIPPATAGVAPKLALSYASRMPGSVMGPGWSIAGASQITRCRQARENGDFMSGTTPVDGNPPPVNFTVTDRFCLDGMRLLLRSGMYGVFSSTYSPETDPTTLVTYTGPYFTVQRKDGTTSTYGDITTSSNSAPTVTVGGSFTATVYWNLSRVQDSSGNYIDYLYSAQPSGTAFPFSSAAVETVLSQVNYTGHATSPVSLPYASIIFNYNTQPIGQVRLGYQAGVAFLQSQQLSSVSVTNGGTAMRYYALTYGTSASGSGLQQLNQVQECRDSSKTVCFPATTFAWSQATYSQVADSNQTGPSFVNLAGYKIADVDGDGRQDIVYAINGDGNCGSNSSIYVGFLDQTASHQMTLTTLGQKPVCATINLQGNDQSWYLLDYDGDGKADLLIGGGVGSTWAIYKGVGRPGSGAKVFDDSTNLIAGLGITVPTGLTAAAGILLDLNGDGLPDFLYPTSANSSSKITNVNARLLTRQNDGSLGFSAPYTVTLSFSSSDTTCVGGSTSCYFGFFNNNGSHNSAIATDINSDGRADLTLMMTSYTPLGSSQSSGSGSIQPAFAPDIGTQQGANSPDAFGVNGYWYQFTVGTITPAIGATQGNITFSEYWSGSVANDGLPGSNGFYVVDLNNDGLADIFYQDPTTPTKYWVRVNTGFGYQAPIAITGLPSDPTTLQFADINGDGRTDILFPSGSSYQYVTLTPSTSTAWTPGTAQPAPAGLKYTSGWNSLIGDFDGDAIPDQISFLASGGSNLYTSRVAGGGTCTSTTDSASCSRYHAHDAITVFTNGYGATTTVAYQPLTNEGVYQRGGENTLNDTSTPKRSSLLVNTDFGWYSPVFDVLAPMYVVSMVKSSAPIKGNPNNVSTVYYAYTGALMQAGGRGFLGFFENLSFDANDSANEGNQYMVSLNAYAQRYPFTGIPENSFKTAFTGSFTRGLPKLDTCANNIEDASNCFLPAGSYPWPWPYNTGVIVANGGAVPACNGAGCTAVSVSDCTSTATQAVTMPQDLGAGAFTPPAVAQPVFPYAHITVDSQADLGGGTGLNGAQVTSGTTGYFCYDTNSPSHGNLVNSRTITSDGAGNVEAQKLTANTFTDDTSHWYLGRLTHSDITFVRPNTPSVTRSTDFTYDPATGLLTSEEVEKGQGANLDLLTAYTLDAYGNRTGAYQCSNGFTTATCKSTAGFAQQQSGTTVHRYAKTAFDGIGRYSTGSALPFYSASGSGNLSEQTAISVSSRDEFGNATSQSSINGLTQTSEFGALGRPYFAADNTGKASTTTFRLCNSGGTHLCSSDASLKFRSQTVAAGGPTTWTYFDILGRPVVKIAQAFDNNPSSQKFTAVCTYEDGHNRPVYQSEPFFLNVAANAGDGGAPTLPNTAASPCSSASYATTNTYDVLGRSTLVTHPDGGTVSTSYVGLNSFVTNPRHYTFETDKNALGEVVETRDPDVPGDNSGLIVDTGYDAAGDVLTVTRDALNNGNSNSTTKIVSQFYYDMLGRKTSQTDPDAGSSSFTYNAAGDVISQTDAKNQTVMNSFDALGRHWKRTTTVGSDGNTITDTWIFDAATGACNTGHSCGQLVSESRSSTTGTTFSRSLNFDSYGRSAGRNTSIAGSAYSEVTAYDGYGRPMSQQDASGYTLTTNYTPQGYLDDLTDSRVGTLYQVNTMTARGQVLQDKRGNVTALTSTATFDPASGRISTICSGTNCGLQDLSYQFDKAGNLTQRERATSTAPTIEVFTNDALNRLKLAQLTKVQGTTTSDTTAQIFYDLLGNVCTKNGLNYSYAGFAGCTNHGSAGSPQAVTQVGGTTYQYDPDGNQTTSNSGRALVYNALNQLATASAGTAQTAFQYTPDGDRFLRTDSGSAVPPTDCPTDNTPNDRIFCNGFEASSTGATQTTTYVGNVEIIKTNGTVSEMRRYLGGVAIDYAVSQQTRYLFADHLGSVDVIASSTGALIEMASFDVHGSRRDPYTWQGTASPIGSTTHGFTGQEHVDTFGFIHFNGRIYDPALGRMLQADPLTGPGNQSLNRYSYVINNPLALTDPTGYSWLHDLDRLAGWITFGPFFPSVRNDYYAALANPYVRMAGAIVAAYFTFGGASALLADAGWSSAAAAAGASAAAGFASGAIETGTFEGGLYGAFSAELFFGIGSAFNGASWAHAGGTIGPTDLNAVGFTAKVLAHGIAGGALSSLQGGKFGDGFIGAGMSEALSPAVSSLHNEGGRVTVAALIGGTASRLSGGKFTNGAFSAAFGQLFNDEAHNARNKRAPMPITDAERTLAANGDVEGFWEARQQQGDPIADIALASLHPSGSLWDDLFGGGSVNDRLEAFSRVYLGHSADFDSIRVDLMNAHIGAVDADQEGIIGLLSPGQVYDYHQDVFGRYGLPTTTFGGSPITGARWEAYATRAFWCGGCDQ